MSHDHVIRPKWISFLYLNHVINHQQSTKTWHRMCITCRGSSHIDRHLGFFVMTLYMHGEGGFIRITCQFGYYLWDIVLVIVEVRYPVISVEHSPILSMVSGGVTIILTKLLSSSTPFSKCAGNEWKAGRNVKAGESKGRSRSTVLYSSSDTRALAVGTCRRGRQLLSKGK